MDQVVKASFTSGSLLMLGDLLCQRVTHHGSKDKFELDKARTARFALAGFTLHGPLFHHGFKLLDRTAARMALNRTASIVFRALLLQCTIFPVYLSMLFPFLGVLEGRKLRDSWERTKVLVPKAFSAGAFYWPVLNVLNFRYVPSGARLAFGASAGVVWNVILSYINSHRRSVAA